MKKVEKNNMPPLVPEEEEDAPVRTGSGAKWVTLLCVVLAIALIVASLPSGISAVTKVNSKVLSAEPVQNTISTVLSAGGTLAAQEGVAQSLPQGLEIKTYYVKNSQSVSAGDPIAAVDPVAAAAAAAELQEILETLDEALVSAAEQSNASSIQAGTAGRVKRIYAQKDTAAADTMYAQGALLLLSLDGLMAVDIPTALEVGQAVQVTLSDGSVLPGTVDSVSDGVSTVTLSDEKAAPDDSVTVSDQEGAALGSGTLYIHSALRVTGAFGTVSAINVKLDQKVSAGTTLLTLKDTGRTAEYARLLNRRAELETQMDSLTKLSRDGILYADCDGIVSGVDSSVSYTDPATLTRTRSQASPGYTVLGGARMASDGDSSEDPDDGEASGGGEAPGGGENPGGGETPGGGDNPGGDETPVQQEYTLGLVLRCEDGTVTYLPQGTLKLAENSALPSLSLSGNPNGGASVSTGDYAVKTVSAEGWVDADPSQITQGDTIIFGNGVLVFQHGSQTQTPNMDLSSLIPSGFSAGSYSGGTAATPAYDTYDTTQQDAAIITADEEMTVQIQVDELDVLTLQTGMTADITLDALSGSRFTGTITAINPYGENSGGNTKYTVTVTLPRAENMLPGMNASVKITTAVSAEVPTIPAEAIVFDAGKSWLYTGYDEKSDTLTDPVEIRTGLSDGSLVELLSGLPEGSRFYYRYADSIEYSFVK